MLEASVTVCSNGVQHTELQRYNTRNGFTTSERYFHIQYCYTARTKEKLFCGTYFLVCLCLLTRSS